MKTSVLPAVVIAAFAVIQSLGGPLSAAEPAKGAAEQNPAEPSAKPDAPVKLVDHATFVREVAELPPQAQIAQVEARMLALNPGSKGSIHAFINSGVVTHANPDLTNVGDISPLRALVTLKELRLALHPPIRGKKEVRLADISPLRGLKLEAIHLQGLEITDIAALEGMPLRRVGLLCGRVRSIKPLAGMPLASFSTMNSPVNDFSPLRGAPLQHLEVGTGSPLKDLTFLRGTPLKSLDCHDKALIVKVAPMLRGIPTLETINKEPVAEVMKRIRLRMF